jgi:hypothetical protein
MDGIKVNGKYHYFIKCRGCGFCGPSKERGEDIKQTALELAIEWNKKTPPN